MSDQNTFKRYEMKYLINHNQKRSLLQTMARYMEGDAYGRSTICNIYYDTPDYLLIRRSLEKPIYKEKLRVRSYGIAKADSVVFMELKKKYKDVVYKRRVSVTEKEAMNYLNLGIPLAKQNQITNELQYVCAFYKKLQPTVFLSYEREAFYGKEDKELRITFDENILWREEDLSLCTGVYGTPLLQEDMVLMEIKIAGAMPLWLAQLLSENHIYKTTFSKYGTAYKEMLRQKTGNRMGKGERKYA